MKWYIQGLVFGYLSVPQRTGRLGRGLEMETAIRSTPCNWGCLLRLTRSSLWLLFLLFFILKVCGFLGLGGAGLLELCRGSISGRSPGKALDRTQIRISNRGSSRSSSTVSSIELSFLCLDSIESGGRAGASGLGSLPPSLRVVFSFPWLERRGSVRLLGREPPWSGEGDLLLGMWGPWTSSSCLKNQKPSSPNF
ncbi:unnamed protein product [Microthlaspi erraticum]|uniref:Uncharacterized protein n=1 Tax=Microthlaspi erraticum TaxID=1685480 RepID=A0A6D2K623_9BRAS|nr:unnamed protein product [Microthlaspi erraticum]